ncbi:MAG TPA: FAD-dependent oxidoreductase, partial [Armatimonadota bacterium]|nr:FAD-dependent oxidoreductase [Armatimonadota bacterium]
EAARHEGVEILDRVVPARVDATRNSVNLTLLPVRAMRRDPDGTPRFDVEEGPGWQIRAARLLYAVGQEADLSFLPPSLAQGQRLRVDAWGQTSLPGVFAGGDITGAYGVAEAVGSAKRAVIGIDAWLRRLPMEGLEELVAVGDSPIVSMHAYHAYRHGERVIPSRTEVRIDEINLDYFPPAARARPREVDPEIRASGFLEVALPLSADEAREEAGRCFNCGTCNMCGNCFIFCPDSSVFQRPDWGFAIDLDHCKGCGVCVEECPRQAMSMVPESESVSEGCE